GDVVAPDEVLGVELADRALGLDELVHQRLRHRRVVALVVAPAAVAHDVDDDVLVELLPELEGELGGPHAGLRVVAVDVEDRRLDHPGDVRGVQRGPARGRGGREADLVVDDDVDGAAGAVATQLALLQGLRDDALTGEGRVTVHEDRQHGEVLAAVVEPVLLRTDDALEHRVDRLEVTRVGREVDLGLRAVLAGELALGAEVVLHVAGTLDGLRVELALELPEDLAVGLAGDVGQDVEAPAVRHADADLVHVLAGGPGEDAVEDRDDGLAALEG